VGNHPFKKPDGVKLTAWAIHRYVRVLKTFFTWAVREEILSNNPATKLKKPQLPKDEIKAFSEDEVKTLLEVARAQSYRDYAIVLLLLDSGLRKKELVDLVLDDINLLTGIITIRHGKGNKSRQVCVGKVCRKVLWLYVNEHRKPRNETEKAFFLNSKGQALNYFTLGTIMTRLSKKCNFKVYAHKCRHTFATNLAKKTGNAFLLAQVLGHSDLETSKGYIHLAQGDIQSLSSPMDELLK